MKQHIISTQTAPAYPTYNEVLKTIAEVMSFQSSHPTSGGWAVWLWMLALALKASCGMAEQTDRESEISIQALHNVPDMESVGLDEMSSGFLVRVAPLLAEAMENDGRGGFGCMSVASPVFMAEDEAIELIRKELADVGVQLQSGLQPEGVSAPDEIFHATKLNPGLDSRVERALRPLRLTMGDSNKNVYIRYVSIKDHPFQRDTSESVFGVNLPDVVREAADDYAEYRTTEPNYIGIFFDPLAIQKEIWDSFEGFPEEYASLQMKEWRAGHRQRARRHAKERLRLQVQHFIEYLRSEGVLDEQKKDVL